MVGVYLTVWVREPTLEHVRGVQVTSVGTGVMGMLGNKGEALFAPPPPPSPHPDPYQAGP